MLVIDNEVFSCDTRPVIPKLLRDSVIGAAHSVHFGMITTKCRVCRNVWWPGLDKDVESMWLFVIIV